MRLGMLLSALWLLAFFGASPRSLAQQTSHLKANLDLPFDALATADEEEEVAEVVVFFGQAYEASAIVFALDESGSMTEEGRWKLQSREVKRAVSELSEKAELSVVYYGSDVSSFRKVPVTALVQAKAAAKSYVNSRSPDGDTCLGEGVVEALRIVRKSKSKHRAVVVTSDGRPDNCTTGDSATPKEVEILLKKTLVANPGRKVMVHTVWVGSSRDEEGIAFMKRLAATHGGTFRQVSN